MGLALLLKLSLKCFLDILAWPLLSLGYPLCASIRAIETDSNSDIQKLITYWVLFSLISLFDHTFARLLEWLSFWPYIKLMAILWLVVPHFDGSYYVYENLVRPCFSVNPWVFIERYNKRRAEFLLNKENFLIAAESYVKENGPEALERLIASKRTKPNDVKEIKAVEVIQNKEVTAERKCKDPNVAQREIKAVEVTENKEAVTAKGVNQTTPNLAQSENHVFAAAGSKETTTIAGSDSKLPEIPASKKVQKEWTCALCQVTTPSETVLNNHLQGKKHKAKELKVNEAAKNKGSPAPTAKKSDQPEVETNKSVSDNGSNQKNARKQEEKVKISGMQKNPNKTGVESKESELWCNVCNMWCHGELQMDFHLKGRKHLARIRELNDQSEY